MNRSRITGAILLRWDDCTSILSKHLTTLLQRPIQLCHMVEDYDYWCIALKTGRFSIPELHVLLDAISATTTDFPDLIPDDSDRTRSFSMSSPGRFCSITYTQAGATNISPRSI